jgi:putative membrane protein
MLMNLIVPLALVVKMDQLLETLVTTLIFVAIGIVIFAVTYGILGLIYPIKKEIEEDHNTALGIVIGAIMIGIALIIAAAIQG